MPRLARLDTAGFLQHVIVRGIERRDIFNDEHDRQFFVERLLSLLSETVYGQRGLAKLHFFLQQATEKFRCRIHGFCLMTNHIQLILQVSDIPLAQIMQSVPLRFTKWINFSQNRTGHVFQERYKALLLDADAYLLQLVRYVHLNPVRAGMVAMPELYPWTGHRAYLGREIIPWLTTDWILSQFSDRVGKAQQAYDEFVHQESESCRQAKYHDGTVAGIILGDDRFADDGLRLANCRRDPDYSIFDIVAVVCHSYGVTDEQIQTPG